LTIRIGPFCSDNDVVDSIPLTSPAALTERPDESSESTPSSTKPALPSPPDPEADCAARRLPEIPSSGRRRRSSRPPCFGHWIGAGCADDDVIDAVAIDIPCRADGDARVIAGVDALEHEPGTAVASGIRKQTAELEGCRKTVRPKTT
jgi:hypothetical protein